MKQQKIKEKEFGRAIFDEATKTLSDISVIRSVPLDTFMMVYFNSMPELCNLDGRLIKMLIQCWMNVSVESIDGIVYNVIRADGLFRHNVKASLDLTDKAINLYLSQLCIKKVLSRFNRGVYILNPEYCWVGKLEDRTKCRLVLECGYSNEEFKVRNTRIYTKTEK